MNHSILSSILRRRLTPQVLHFLEVSRHSVTIWDIGAQRQSFAIVIYDEVDLLTVVWVHDRCSCTGGGQFHTHLCPDDLRRYWARQQRLNRPIRPPHRITFSPTRARPYECPFLNELRAGRSELIRDALRQRPCLLPGPLANLVVRPPAALQHLFPGLFALPEPPLEIPRPVNLSVSKYFLLNQAAFY